MKHILSVDQFTKADLADLCHKAALHQNLSSPYFSALDIPKNKKHLIEFPYGWTGGGGTRWIPSHTKGKILTNLFYETSSRTYASFISAILRLGGNYIPIHDANIFSSVAKGETLEDTIRTMGYYSEVIVLRHKESGAPDKAASVASVPVINAGNGTFEHPTQALLDFFTILVERGWTLYNEKTIEETINGLTVTMMGDLDYGRTVKSLAKLLRNYDVTINWVSPEALKIPKEFVKMGDNETCYIDEVIEKTDVLYLVRTQFERHANKGFPLKVIFYDINETHMKKAKSDMVLMHPLPRNEELPTTLDSDPRSAYFRQMQYGLYMRMAVLETVLK